MARIVLTCWGSHGDIDPFLGLGLGLKHRGHVVSLATLEYYRGLVESSGLGFSPIRPNLEPTDIPLVRRIMDARRGSEFLLRQILFPAIEQMYDDISIAAEGADLLVSHPVTFATPIVAERRRMAWASAVLAPTSMFSVYDYPAVPPAPWLKSLQRLGSWPGKVIVGVARRETFKWAVSLRDFRARLGLAPGANPVLEGQHSPHLVLALYSRVLGDPQPDWPPHTVVTGHVFYDAPHGMTLSDTLEHFLRDGPAPVVFTLGSSVVVIATDFWHESIDAVRRIGMRAVLLAGPDSAPVLERELQRQAGNGSRDIIALDRAPHSLLFPRASAVVQQCGIGTLAQSLRSGRPMLAVPYSHDQPDNALRARSLGMARVLYPPRYRGAKVAGELQTLLTDRRYRAAAERVAETVRGEDGVEAACDALERTFGLTSHAQ